MRRLDGFNDDELIILKQMLTCVARKMNKSFSFADDKLMRDTGFRRFLEITLRIHQIFALVDVNYSDIFSAKRSDSITSHYGDVAEQLKLHNGLNYCPRERTTSGRIFEHAADCRVLIDHL